MSFCPEDGTLMRAVEAVKLGSLVELGIDSDGACYECPLCGAHWSYSDGAYTLREGSCPVCMNILGGR
jgi:hypothetical protein